MNISLLIRVSKFIKSLELDKLFTFILEIYLLKGADASLWQFKNFGNYAVSCFLMNKKLDSGEVLLKKKLNFKNLSLKSYQIIK